MRLSRFASAWLLVLLVCLFTGRAQAHFPWLSVTDDGKAIYYFGESPADQTYHLPDALSSAQVGAIGHPGALVLEPIETDEVIGLISTEPVPKDATLFSQTTYGLFRDAARLDYYALHLGGKMPTTVPADTQSPLDLNATLVDTDTGVDVLVTWKGKPLAGAEVKLFCDEGHEEGVGTTNDEGLVSFTDQEVEDGINGLLIGHTVKQSGTWDGQEYTTAMHYLTVTFRDPEDEAKIEG